jgi:HK97 family phage portal protein
VAGKIEIGSFKMEWGGASQKSVGPTFDLKGTEAWSNIFGYQDNFSEEAVTEKRAHGLATVYTCINVRSRTIASLPINPMIEENGTKRVLTDHAVYYPLAQQANSYLSSAQMFLSSMIHSDSWGNSIIGINRDSRYRPKSFDLIEPGEWGCTKHDGEAWYKINGMMYGAHEVLHFRWFSYNGLEGISPIRLNQITMGGAFKQERYQASALSNKPPGFLSYEGTQQAEQKAQNQDSWKRDIDRGRVPLLTGKWQYHPLILPPGEAEYVSTAGLTDQKICGIYQMPPAFVQNYDRMTWNNSEQVDLLYAKHTVTPICRIIEQEINMKLFTEKEKKNHFVKFNMNGLLRGDIAARAAFYTAMRNIGGMNGNEIRDREDMNSYEGGDIYTVQGANVPIDQLRDFYSKEVVNSGQETQPKKNGTPINGNHYQTVN